MSASPRSLALFCKVVDNFGDIGICWRLSKQWAGEYGLAVTLWVDDLQSFRRICPAVVVDVPVQTVEGVVVRHWFCQDAEFAAGDIADIVIEFFACDIPPNYVRAMAQRSVKPVWINLEGLTAEEWVEGCHTLPSSHPQYRLTKHFFFPGFTEKTGGLIREESLLCERDVFLSDAAKKSAFFARLNLDADEIASYKVSMFCYPHAPLATVFDAWSKGRRKLTCLLPVGVATQSVQDFFGVVPEIGVRLVSGSLTLHVIDFLAQPDYDKLLWVCDCNFVRGEDSFVRAQWAGRPFIWHIYPQDEKLHIKKLKAFLTRFRFVGGAGADMFLAWNATDQNQVVDWEVIWEHFMVDADEQRAAMRHWEREMTALGDFSSNLMEFVHLIEKSR